MLYRLSYQGKRSARNQSICLEGIFSSLQNLSFYYKKLGSVEESIVEPMLCDMREVLLSNFLTLEHSKLDLAITLPARQLHLPPLPDQGFL